MLLLKIITLFFIAGIIYVKTQAGFSPCPDVFYYGKELEQKVLFLNLKYEDLNFNNSEIFDMSVELKFYVPERTINMRNVSDEPIRITLKIDRKTVLENIFRKEGIPFQIYFVNEPLTLADINDSPWELLHYCNLEAQENRSTVRAVYELKYSKNEIEEVHKQFLANGDLDQEKCTTNEEGSSWIGSVRIKGVHKCTATFIGQLRALSSDECFKQADKNLNLDDVELVLYNNQVLKIWKYEYLINIYTITFLYIWPNHLSKQIIPACISRKFYTISGIEKMDHRIFLIDRQVNVNASNIITIGRLEVLVEGLENILTVTDRGAAVMTKLEDGWYLSNIVKSIKDFASVNWALSKIIARKGKVMPSVLVPPTSCRSIFQYGNEHGKDIAIVEAEIPIGATYSFNLRVEFFVPDDVYETRKSLNITVKRSNVIKENEHKFFYTIYFSNKALPLKRVLFNNEVECEDTSDKYEYNPTVTGFHALISDPVISAEYLNYVNRTINEPVCGIKQSGTNNSYPWVASLFVEDTYYVCAVTFISKRIAVTTQACLNFLEIIKDHKKLLVRLFNDEVIKEFQLYQHPDNIEKTLARSLWLLIVEKDINATNFTPICLWKDYEDTMNGMFVYHVYKKTNFEFFRNHIKLYNIPDALCESDGLLDDKIFCTEYEGYTFDNTPATGYGSPFMFKYNGKWHLKGLYHQTRPKKIIFIDTTDYFYWFQNLLAPDPVLRSTCQEFQYGEKNGKNVAFLEFTVRRSQIYGFNVSLEFYLEKKDPIQSTSVEITLQNKEDDIIEKIFTRNPVTYLVTFPNKALTIRRIYFSGISVCENLVDTFGRKPKIITASHAFQPSIDVIAKYNHHIEQGINEIFCGNLKRTHKPLSVGGEHVNKQHWPWVISLYIKGAHKCSGTLISKSVGVTAAHCLEPGGFRAKPEDVTLLLFSNQYVNIWDYIIHPFFEGSGSNDIALLLLNEDIKFTEFVPICVWPFLEDITNLLGTLVGYGATELQKAGRINRIDLNAVSADVCRASNPKFKKLVNVNTFCAKGPKGTGPCQGDSGGGFVFEINGIWYLRGVVSASLENEYGECDTENYTVFTDIEKYFNWIKNSNKTRRSVQTDQDMSTSGSYFVGDQWVWTR